MSNIHIKLTIIFFVMWALPHSRVDAQRVGFSRSNSTFLPINSKITDYDFGPVLIDGVLYFASSNHDEKAGTQKEPFSDIYTLQMSETQSKHALRSRVKELCGDYHDGPVAYCQETGELFITRTDIESVEAKNWAKSKKQIPLKIVVYQEFEDGWFYKEDFPFNVPNYSVGHPSINSAGDTLVFVSDQPGGYGNADLYLAVRKDGIWLKPLNMGSKVNTRRREITPFINSDGTLYFASDGLRGKGGFDLYLSSLKSNVDKKPINLERPINSSANDYGICIHPNQKIGYFVSGRKNNDRRDMIFCMKNKNYQLSEMQIDSSLLEVSNKIAAVGQFMDEYAIEMAQKQFIYTNLKYHINYELIDRNNIPDLKISYYYKFTNDTIRFGLNTFNMRRYTIDYSNPIAVLLEMVKKSVTEELSEYFTAGKNVDFTINGEADALPLWDSLQYKGEFGKYVRGGYVADNQVSYLELLENETINDQSLSFLRSYAIKNYISNEIDIFKGTNNVFKSRLIPYNKLNVDHEWAKVEIVVHNVFANF